MLLLPAKGVKHFNTLYFYLFLSAISRTISSFSSLSPPLYTFLYYYHMRISYVHFHPNRLPLRGPIRHFVQRRF